MPRLETKYEIADAIATITLNRPDKLNAWTEIIEADFKEGVAHFREKRGPVFTGR